MSTPSQRHPTRDGSTRDGRSLKRPAHIPPSSSAPRPSQFAPTPRFLFSSSARGRASQDTPAAATAACGRTGVRRDDDIDDSAPTDDDGDTGGDRYSRTPFTGRVDPGIKHARQLRDSISDSSGGEGSISDGMLLDSIEPTVSDVGYDGLPSQQAARQKRRRASSSPPIRRNKEPIHISSSPPPLPYSPDRRDEEAQVDEPASDSSMDVMPAPRRPPRRGQLPDKESKMESVKANGNSTTLPEGAETRSPTSALPPPKTPVRTPNPARFRFDTPLRTPSSIFRQGSQTPAFQSLDASTSLTPAASQQTHPPRFTLPSSQARSAGGGRGQVERAIPLPELFSPRKRGSRFVPGGLAETVRDMVLDAGARMHVATSRKIKVKMACQIGDNGALLVEAEEAEVSRDVNETASVSKILLVGADAHVASAVRQGSTIDVRHGWYLPGSVLVSMGLAEESSDEKLEVCWGPL